MKKIYGVIALLAIAGALFAADDSIAEGKALVDSRISCDNLTDGQLESIGDYLMEQMHPVQAHEYMDSMMGGEGSASLRSVHIQMAQAIYCGRADTPITYGGMMGMGMIGGGMMRGWGTTSYGYGMMGSGASGTPYGMMVYRYPAAYGLSVFDILLAILLVGLILVVYAHAWQKIREDGRKKARQA